MIPKYLRKISESVRSFNYKERIKIKCKCGCSTFIVNVYCEPCDMNIKRYREIIKENDKYYYVRRNFIGKIVEKIECEDTSPKMQRNIVKVKCEKCGKEYIIFDNYLHGYNSLIEKEECISSDEIDLTNWVGNQYESLNVYAEIYQDVPYEEFKEEFGKISMGEYSNLFGYIYIYGFNNKKRKIKIFQEETA